MNFVRCSTWSRRAGGLAAVLLVACSTSTAKPEATATAPTPSAAEPEIAAIPPLPAAPPAPDRVAIRAQLADHRAAQIAHLHAYRERRQFPYDSINARPHIFRDPRGRLCAVANLIEADGRHELVEATVHENNSLEIANVHTGPMLSWVITSGLTQEELTRIQVWPGYEVPEVRKAPSAEERMTAKVVKHVAEMEVQLINDTEISLDIAVERYVAALAGGL